MESATTIDQQDPATSSDSRQTQGQNTAEYAITDLGIPAEVVDAASSVQNVVTLFQSQPELTSIVLKRAGQVTGLVMRDKLLLKLATQFGHSLYGRKPIEILAIPLTIILPINTPVATALTAAIDRPSECLYDDLVAVGPHGDVWIVRLRELIAQQAGVHAQESKLRMEAEKRAQNAEVLGEMKARFLRHVTHELRAPVNALVGLADLARSAMASGSVEQTRAVLDKLSRSANDVRALINNLLDLSKIEAGRMSVDREWIALGALVEEGEIIAMGLQAQSTAQMQLHCRDEDKYLRVHTDPIRLRQVVTNLLSNAFKFTPNGVVELRWSVSDRDLRLEVRDSGIGIPADKLNAIFDSFYQVDDPLVRSVQGSGLGLTITRHIVELLEGTIQVASEQGRGTSFAVLLPGVMQR